MPGTTPPSHVRTAKSELIAELKAMGEDLSRTERSALEKAVAIGKKLLALKLDSDTFPEDAEQTGIHERRRQRCMDLARNEEMIVSCKTIAEALQLITDQRGSKTDNMSVSGQSASVNGQAGATSLPPSQHCAACARKLRVGQELPKNCPDCKKFREPTTGGRSGGSGTRSRSGGTKPTKSGAPMPKLEEVNELLGKAEARLEAIARANGLVLPATQKGASDGGVRVTPKHQEFLGYTHKAQEAAEAYWNELPKATSAI